MDFIVALTDDNAVNRNAFLQKIQALGNLSIAFIAKDGNECLEKLNSLPNNKLPQVVFMDLEMPHMNGIETIGIAKSLHPDIHFIVLTVFDDDDKIFEAIKAGASGYLLKHEPAGVLHEAVINVIEFGGAPMSPAVARKSLQMMRYSVLENSKEKQSLPDMITIREEEILKHMVNGWDAKRIAVELDISVLTVRKHIANIYDKLHVQSKAEIISMAHNNKWFTK
ncbi:MAG: response regulator transcription factor [Chitinophagaceae bacterium]|nr:response regulator transcription factor [Chitinophagaceae bacterium]